MEQGWSSGQTMFMLGFSIQLLSTDMPFSRENLSVSHHVGDEQDHFSAQNLSIKGDIA